jgi:hypothetical protein
MHNIKNIVPQVVVLVDMPVKATAVSVKESLLDVADEAHILHILLLLPLLVSQLGERVDDDTEQEIQHHNDDQDVEREVVDEFHEVDQGVI